MSAKSNLLGGYCTRIEEAKCPSGEQHIEFLFQGAFCPSVEFSCPPPPPTSPLPQHLVYIGDRAIIFEQYIKSNSTRRVHLKSFIRDVCYSFNYGLES